jgi:hypothetical protein
MMCQPHSVKRLTFGTKNGLPPAALAPVGPALVLYRQRLARFHVQNNLIDLASIQGALDAEQRGQQRSP